MSAACGRLADPERYRSGRNGGASKASCRVTGTGVRIPPSPPTFAHACHNERELRLARHAKVVHRSSQSEGGPLDGKANLPKAAPAAVFVSPSQPGTRA